MSLTTDTHDYDGRIGKVYKSFHTVDLRELIQPPTFDQCLDEILTALPYINLSTDVKLHVKKTIHLFKTQPQRNKDTANNISVEDLLPKVWRFVMEYELSAAKVFYEQLSEISSSGPCPQGRTTRLMNHYTVHMQLGEKDPVYRACMKHP